MNDLTLEINEMLEQDFSPATISRVLGIPVLLVYELADKYNASVTN